MHRRAGAMPEPGDREAIVTLALAVTGELFHGKYGLGASPDDVVRMIDEALLGSIEQRLAREGALELARTLAEHGIPMGGGVIKPAVIFASGGRRERGFCRT